MSPEVDVVDPPRDSKTSGGNIIGWFPSSKSSPKLYMRYRSTIERDLMCFLEFDQDVVSYRSQPFQIRSLAYKGEFHTYVPDFEVIRRLTKQIVECKPEDELESEDARRQFTIGRAWSPTHGYEYLVMTDTMLRTGHRLDGLNKIWKYHRKRVTFSTLTKSRDLLLAHPDGILLADLLESLSGQHADYSHLPEIYSLLFKHVLETDLDQPLGHNSLIWLKQ